MILRME